VFAVTIHKAIETKEVITTRMWPKILLGLVGVLAVGMGVAYIYGVRGMKETLNAQISHVDLSGVVDGTYQGKYEAGRFKASVEVTVKDHKIVGISPLGLDSQKPIDRRTLNVFDPAIGRIITSQSPNLDAISGSTATTKSLLKAVESALVDAGGKLLRE